jgi:RNA polymerase sigma-70 factor (ECF subfamily)
MNETELLEQAKRGERQAIEALYHRYAPRVFAVVRRLAGDDALAEDWAQEAWVRAIRALPNFRGDAQFSTWLHRIAVNCALHGQRWRGRHSAREEALSPELSVAPREDTTLLKVRLERALAQIPERMRQVLVLHDVEGHTHEEIAEILGIMPGTSKSQLFKARAHMRSLLRTTEPVNGEEVICLI